ncbi:large ribosomal subunit protein mL40 [Phymastichus coffea]|uniref:large ribosomal subunit protein mL40 n=1 Tax=Phymastichus coffea TaxID=108790 RepID=UPI00273CAD77|nr:large ribosomal subunit protein mL40 [Phymastichus coffea]
MFQRGVLNIFPRFMVNNVLTPVRNISISEPLYFNGTNVLFGEPLKKKKKLDPALIRAKEERRKRKLEKAIRRLEKHTKQLKPIAELNLTIAKKAELEAQRKSVQELTVEEIEERAQKLKEWNKLKNIEHKKLMAYIYEAITKQDEAYDKLRLESEEKYQKAIQIDPTFLPYSYKGPPETPPVPDYIPPDGDYIDITRKFEGET